MNFVVKEGLTGSLVQAEPHQSLYDNFSVIDFDLFDRQISDHLNHYTAMLAFRHVDLYFVLEEI
jgi:hypothetical protein